MQMDELRQQNAAFVEEATASSQAMSEQARALDQMMSHYHGRQPAPSGPAFDESPRRRSEPVRSPGENVRLNERGAPSLYPAEAAALIRAAEHRCL